MHPMLILLLPACLMFASVALGAESERYSEALHQANALYTHGSYREAEAMLRALLADPALEKDGASVARAHNLLAAVLIRSGDFNQAKTHAELAVTTYDKLPPPKPSEITPFMYQADLAYALGKIGQHDDAIRRYESILARMRENGDPEFRRLYLNNFAKSTMNLANNYRDIGRYWLADKRYHEAQELCSEASGPESFDSAILLNNYSLLVTDMGKYEGALVMNKKSARLILNMYDERHPELVPIFAMSALNLRKMGKMKEAEAYLVAAREVADERLPKGHPFHSGIQLGLATIFLNTDRCAEADLLLQQSLTGYQTVFGNEHRSTGMVHLRLGDLQQVQGNHAQAVESYTSALAILTKTDPPGGPDFEEALRHEAVSLEAVGRTQEAKVSTAKADQVRIRREFEMKPPQDEMYKAIVP